MTIPVLFLLGAVGLSIILGLVVWLVGRPRKPKFGSSIDAFNKDLSALAPRHVPNQSAGRSRAAGKPGPRPRR